MGARVNFIKSTKAEKIFFESLPLKYRCMWRIGVETGLRIHDILHTKKKDVLSGKWYTKEHKTKKRKLCTVSSETIRLCEIYAKQNHTKYKRLLFYNPTTDNHFTRQSVWKMYRDRAVRAKLQFIGAHSSRHQSAYMEYLRTGDIEKVRKFLNHDNTNTTKLYLKNKRKSNKNSKKHNEMKEKRAKNE